MKVVVHVDGGARGNPGPGVPPRWSRRPEARCSTRPPSCWAWRPTTSPSTGRCCSACAGARARRREVELVNDSELVAKQITGQYKVKHPAMRPLHLDAMAALRAFERWSIRTVPRAQNADADALVNAALDAVALALVHGSAPTAAMASIWRLVRVRARVGDPVDRVSACATRPRWMRGRRRRTASKLRPPRVRSCWACARIGGSVQSVPSTP